MEQKPLEKYKKISDVATANKNQSSAYVYVLGCLMDEIDAALTNEKVQSIIENLKIMNEMEEDEWSAWDEEELERLTQKKCRLKGDKYHPIVKRNGKIRMVPTYG